MHAAWGHGRQYGRFPGLAIARREQRAQGIYRHRVWRAWHPLSDYDRYACEWGYAYNVPAGDETRVLDIAERPLPAAVVDHGFWLPADDY